MYFGAPFSLPGQGIMVVTNSQEPTKTQHCVRHLAAHLVDHHSIDRADLLIVHTVDGGAFNLVAADESSSFACFRNDAKTPLWIAPVSSTRSMHVPFRLP